MPSDSESEIVAVRCFGALFRPLPSTEHRPWLLAAGVLAIVTVILMWPYCTAKAVGAGDAYHYALQIADFRAQFRAHQFPPLVGQSAMGLNGNIHTLRTAPFWVHLGFLIDAITGLSLSPFQVQNIELLFLGVAGTSSMFYALRGIGLSSIVLAGPLALLYTTSLGSLGLLFTGDMDATFATIPWIPLLVYGLIGILSRHNPVRSTILSVLALDLIWYAHPPTALWCSVLTAFCCLYALAVSARQPEGWLLLLFAGTVLSALLSYLFYSVGSMHLNYLVVGQGSRSATILTTIANAFKSSGSSFDRPDIQVVMFLFVTWVGWASFRGWQRCLSLFSLLALAAIVPWPGSAFLWSHIPEAVLAVTDGSPCARLQQTMAALGILTVGGWAAAEANTLVRKTLLGTGIALLLVWHLYHLARTSPGRRDARNEMTESNVILTRSSYLLFNQFPRYFSNGHIEPSAEIRLLRPDLSLAQDPKTELFEDDRTAGPWRPIDGGLRIIGPTGRNCALQFDFADPEGGGELIVESGLTHLVYGLPYSGGYSSFGSGRSASHILILPQRAIDSGLLIIHLHGPTARVRARFFSDNESPVLVTEVAPLSFRLMSRIDGWVESPRMFIPGYYAIVNGRERPVGRSINGLVMVKLGRGPQRVTIKYGDRLLWLFYWLSWTSFLLLLAVLLGMTLYPAWETIISSVNAARFLRTVAAGLALCVILVEIANQVRLSRQADGLELLVDLPEHPLNRSEPLVAVGAAGRADVLYLQYQDACHFRVGYDHWGTGGPMSAAIGFVPGVPLRIAVSSPLIPARWWRRAATETSVTVDGVKVLGGLLPHYDHEGAPVAIGRNLVGAGSCGPAFSGDVSRLDDVVGWIKLMARWFAEHRD